MPNLARFARRLQLTPSPHNPHTRKSSLIRPANEPRDSKTLGEGAVVSNRRSRDGYRVWSLAGRASPHGRDMQQAHGRRLIANQWELGQCLRVHEVTTDDSMTPDPVGPVRRGHIGLIVAASMFGGLILALVLTLLVFGGATEPIISGVALLAFALGWTLLAWLSERRTDQPQRWAYVPAIFMGVLGLAHLVFQPSDGVLRAFGWVWPVAAAGLAIWMIIQSRRSLHNWSRPVILYPVLAVLLLAAFGGGYETIREAMDESAYPMPGQLIDVGGHKLHISCTGSGTPTVILEAGLGQPAAMMSGWIQPGVATETQGLRLRPSRHGLERARRDPAGWCRDRGRPPHAPSPGRDRRPVRPRRAFIRRCVRAGLRRAVSR